MIEPSSGAKKLPRSAGMVIFGATGDLTQRKLIPALYILFKKGHLPKRFPIICFARRESSDRTFRESALASFRRFTKKEPDSAVWKRFAANITYYRGDLEDESSLQGLKGHIRARFAGSKYKEGKDRIIYYLATAPEHFRPLVKSLRSTGLATRDSGSDAWPRIVLEKPFGHDLRSAKELNDEIKAGFDEEQIYRIDHYLGKETVQNILVVRFANSIYEQVWNSKFIDNVQITAFESIGIESRAGYYESSGALRDMVQNHMMQLLTYVAMEPPADLSADAIRDEKVKVLRSLKPLCCKDVHDCASRGQYGPGKTEGARVVGYRQEPGVNPKSKTETFVALKTHVHNWRWEGVPFFLRTGKRLKQKKTEIVITFKQSPDVLFSEGSKNGKLQPNRLVIRIQPDEGIGLQFNSKRPVTELAIDPVMMDFCHSCTFSPNTPEAYERLLYDILIGDSTLFTRWDEAEYAWRFVDPIRQAWDADKKPVPVHPAGSLGPKEAERIVKSEGREWDGRNADPRQIRKGQPST